MHSRLVSYSPVASHYISPGNVPPSTVTEAIECRPTGIRSYYALLEKFSKEKKIGTRSSQLSAWNIVVGDVHINSELILLGRQVVDDLASSRLEV